MQKAIWVLWPSFIMAGLMDIVFFALVDPASLTIFGVSLDAYRHATYSVGFFVFWLFAAGDSWLTLFFQRDPPAVNGYCPLPHQDGAANH